MAEDREEGELSSLEEEGNDDVIGSAAAAHALEEGEVQEDADADNGMQQMQHQHAVFRGGNKNRVSKQSHQQHQHQHQQQPQQHAMKRPAPKAKPAKARPEAMLMFWAHQLSPHALHVLTTRHEATQWPASQPAMLEAHLQGKFPEGMIAHILQQVHSQFIALPKNGPDGMLFFLFPTQTARNKVTKFLKDLGVARLSSRSPNGVLIEVLSPATPVVVGGVPSQPPVMDQGHYGAIEPGHYGMMEPVHFGAMEPNHYGVMPQEHWGMQEDFPSPMMPGHDPYYDIDVGMMHVPDLPPHAMGSMGLPPPGARWKRPRNNAGPPMIPDERPLRQRPPKKSRPQPKQQQQQQQQQIEPPEDSSQGADTPADLMQLRNLVLLSMARKASEPEAKAEVVELSDAHVDAPRAEIAKKTSGSKQHMAGTKLAKPTRVAATPSPTPSTWSNSADLKSTSSLPAISALTASISFDFKRAERADCELFDIYSTMGIAQLPPPTCESEFWPTTKGAGANPNSSTDKQAKQPIDSVESKRQELLAKAEQMKRQIQLEEQKRKRRLVARNQSSDGANSSSTAQHNAETGTAIVELKNDQTLPPATKQQELVQGTETPTPDTSVSDTEQAAFPDPTAVTMDASPQAPIEMEIEPQAESKEETFERLKKREQQLKTEIVVRQLKAEIDAQEAELKDALSKLAQARELLDGLNIATNEQEKLVSKLRVEKLELTQKAIKSDAYRIELLSELANARSLLSTVLRLHEFQSQGTAATNSTT